MGTNSKNVISSRWIQFLVFIFLFTSCTFKENRVVVIVNGKEIKIKDLQGQIPKENWNKEYILNYLPQLIEKEVVMYEANRLSMTEEELFSAFNMLKTRKLDGAELEEAFKREFKDAQIAGQQRDDILEMVRNKQFENAKNAYIKEMKDRSTIKIYEDQLDKGL